MNIDSIMKELAEYIRMGEQIAATVDKMDDVLKQIMQAQGVDTLTGTEHKASYKAVTSSRIDTSALKKDMPAVATQYTRVTETRRFTFS
jgi:predicted phage-related endonuclease